MKKITSLGIKLAVGFTILLGILLILFINENSFQKIVTDDIQNISKLSSSIIYSEINNCLTKPIFVGQTIANDLFLKNWLYNEGAASPSDIFQYLSDYAEKYGYNSVFLVSEGSGKYYFQEGVNKTISTENAHDVWYYDFIKSDKSYDLDVDFDEANSNQLTVFVNCRITGDKGELLGVAGVGIKMSSIQALLEKYENEYNLQAFLINESGLVQIDTSEENIEVGNFFYDSNMTDNREKIINNKSTMEAFWYSDDDASHCIITKYVANLDWYIVVAKDTQLTQGALGRQINISLLLTVAIIAIVSIITSVTMSKYNRMLLQTAQMDDITALPNLKMFRNIFSHNAKKAICQSGVIFMFDIDDFKAINDNMGHINGNSVLYYVSQAAKETIGTNGFISRFGGDEFVGAIYGTKEKTDSILYELVEAISKIDKAECANITVSLGATTITRGSKLDAMLREADCAMYRAKDSGKNQVVFFN